MVNSGLKPPSSKQFNFVNLVLYNIASVLSTIATGGLDIRFCKQSLNGHYFPILYNNKIDDSTVSYRLYESDTTTHMEYDYSSSSTGGDFTSPRFNCYQNTTPLYSSPKQYLLNKNTHWKNRTELNPVYRDDSYYYNDEDDNNLIPQISSTINSSSTLTATINSSSEIATDDDTENVIY